MRNLIEEFKRYKGQPIEIITDSGAKICGIEVDYDDETVTLIDKKGRTVLLLNKHIDALIEPQMRLYPLCSNDDCCCKPGYDD